MKTLDPIRDRIFETRTTKKKRGMEQICGSMKMVDRDEANNTKNEKNNALLAPIMVDVVYGAML